MTTTLIIALLFVSVVVGAGLVWWLVTPDPAQVSDKDPTNNFEFRTFEPSVPLKRDQLTAPPQAWVDAMAVSGAKLQRANVKHMVLVHGTLVGDDPTGVISVLRSRLPGVGKNIAGRMATLVKKNSDLWLADTGNFTEKYTQMAQTYLGVPCVRFLWSSENHHLGRLLAATRLAEFLAASIGSRSMKKDDRILLIGHSHAGQVFALLAQLLEYEQFGHKLTSVLEDARIDVAALRQHFSAIQSISIDFVTYGTPVVYVWPESQQYRLLHIVNHRGEALRAGGLAGLLSTRDGDYVQRFGILGSDSIVLNPFEWRLNRKLDEIFGPGMNWLRWRQEIAKSVRVSPYGVTMLVDYRDHATSVLPNGIKTVFGHGVYTRYEAMLFNYELITDHFYS